MSEDILVFLGLGWITVYDAFARLRVELAWGVPCGDVALGGRIAVTFLRMQMQQLRSFHVLQLLENTHQLLDVVSVERPEVADVHAVEDVLLMGDGALDGIRETLQSVLAVIVQ